MFHRLVHTPAAVGRFAKSHAIGELTRRVADKVTSTSSAARTTREENPGPLIVLSALPTIQRGQVDAENLGGAGLVAARLFENPLRVGAIQA